MQDRPAHGLWLRGRGATTENIYAHSIELLVLSRETAVHGAIVFVAVSAVVAADYVGILPESGPAAGVVSVLVLGAIFGGAHLYYAARGEGGTVPVRARWRYVGLLAVLLAVGALVTVGGDRSLGPVGARTLGTVVGVLALAAYVVTESVAGYRASRDSP